MATSQTPQGPKTDVLNDIKGINDILIKSQQISLGLSQDLDESHNKLIQTGGRLGKEYANIASKATDINNSVERTLELTSGLTSTYKNYGKLVENLQRIQVQGRIIEAQKQAFINKLQKEAGITTKEELQTQLASVKQQEEDLAKLKEKIALQEKLRDTAVLEESQIQANNKVVELGREALLLAAELNSEQSKQKKLLTEQALIKLELIEAEEKAVKDAEELTKEVIDQVKGLGKMQILWEKMGKVNPFSAITNLTLASAFKQILEATFEIDKNTTKIANSSGVTKGFAEEITKSYQATSLYAAVINDRTDKALLTVKAQAEAQQQLQAATGQSALYTQQSLQSQIYLTKQLGLSAEEAAKIGQLGLVNSKSTDKVTDNIADQVAGFNKAKGLNLNIRDVLKDVAKVSGVISANYKNDPKAIAQAVSQAKALGVSLQDAAAASRSLLDFESSIENELEAELLTGKAWNLEKARALALSGDTAGALEEELKNVGSLAEFAEQNTVTKEAEAKAIGMTVDQLSDALRQQEVLRTSTVETRKAQEEILKNIKGSADEAKYRAELNAATNGAELLAKQSLVDKQMEYEASMDRVKDGFMSLVNGPMGQLLSGLTSILNTTGGITTAVALGAGYMGFMAARAIATAFASKATAAAIGNWVGAVAAGVAVVSALVALNTDPKPVPAPSVKTMDDGLIAPTGEMVIQTPAGDLVKPNRNDSIIATTNPGGLLNGGGNSNSGNSRAESLLAAILESVSKPSGVYMDSMRVGTSLGMSRSAYA